MYSRNSSSSELSDNAVEKGRSRESRNVLDLAQSGLFGLLSRRDVSERTMPGIFIFGIFHRGANLRKRTEDKTGE